MELGDLSIFLASRHSIRARKDIVSRDGNIDTTYRRSVLDIYGTPPYWKKGGVI
jgi:hypothetical protein